MAAAPDQLTESLAACRCGVCSYAILTAALGWLHDEKATKLWREEVSACQSILVFDQQHSLCTGRNVDLQG